MKKKIIIYLKKAYGLMMSIAFWGGLIPIVPFIIAICIGGNTGEKIVMFLNNEYYPYVIALASLSIVVGLTAMYLGGEEAFSTKSLDNNK